MYLALEDGPPRFRQDITCPIVLRCLTARSFMTSNTGLSPSMAGFPVRSSVTTDTCSGFTAPDERSYNPDTATPVSLALHRFGLVPVRSPLLRESRLMSFPPATKMFQFTGLSPQRLCIQRWVGLLTWVSPFGNPRIIAQLAAPRGISQPHTSFVVSRRLGIHRTPLIACHHSFKARYNI